MNTKHAKIIKYIIIHNVYLLSVLNKPSLDFWNQKSWGRRQPVSDCFTSWGLLHFRLSLRQEWDTRTGALHITMKQYYCSLHHRAHYHINTEDWRGVSQKNRGNTPFCFLKKKKLCNIFTNRIGPYIFHLRTAFRSRTSFQSRVCVCACVCVCCLMNQSLQLSDEWCPMMQSTISTFVLDVLCWRECTESHYSPFCRTACLCPSLRRTSQYGYCFCFFPAKQDSQVHSSMAAAAPAPVQ